MRPEVTGGNALEADPNFFSIIKGIFVESGPGADLFGNVMMRCPGPFRRLHKTLRDEFAACRCDFMSLSRASRYAAPAFGDQFCVAPISLKAI
jgi:hypothetical protein